MTMLDRMRRHKDWLKWSLGFVCLAFVVFYIPDFLRTPTDAATTDTIAVVEGQDIRADEFRRAYQAQLQSYRAAYGGNMSEQLLRQLGIDQQILTQMVDERAALAEANRLGLGVSDAEVAQRVYSIPAFQENGGFIGMQRYQQFLAAQRPPLTPAEFEESVRRSIAVQKLRESVTEWLSVSDKEVEQEYRRRNDKVKLAIVAFNAETFRPSITVSDAEVASYFDAHTADFKIPEKRRIKYIQVNVEELRKKITVMDADVERAYNESIDQYTTPEQVRASHILFKTEGKVDAEVRARAEDVLKQAKTPGADFAALAKKYSEDTSNAQNGGDLDFFGRGRMVPQFDEAVFAMQPGQISDLVKTEFGYHIIKLTDKKPGSVRTLADVKQQLTDQLAYTRAQTLAGDLAEKLEGQIKKPADLDTVAKAEGLQVQESGFFSKEEQVFGIGPAPAVTARAFTLNQGEVSGGLTTSRGYVFETVTQKQDAYIPKLDEVKDRVKEVLVKQRAVELAKLKATEVAGRLKTAPDFDKAAKAAGIEVKTTELLVRDAPIPDLGAAPDLMDAAFKLPKGATSDSITLESGAAVVKVLDKQETTAGDLASNKDTFRDSLLEDRRGRFFSAYLAKAKQKMKIQVNREALQRTLG